MIHSRVPNGDFIYFNPLSILITTHNGTTLYAYHFSDRLKKSANLISGLWKTIEHMFNEIFRSELQIWTLNDTKIIRDIITGDLDIVIYIIFEGERSLAENFMSKLLNKLINREMLDFNNSMSVDKRNRLNEIFDSLGTL